MKEYCDTCASWRMHQCKGCEHFTGTYPQSYAPPNKLHKKKKRRPLGMKYVKYGLLPEQQRELISVQNNKCAICDVDLKSPLLDHNHKTGKARGYLCCSCNIRLSGVENDKFRAQALRYLQNPPAAEFYT